MIVPDNFYLALWLNTVNHNKLKSQQSVSKNELSSGLFKLKFE